MRILHIVLCLSCLVLSGCRNRAHAQDSNTSDVAAPTPKLTRVECTSNSEHSAVGLVAIDFDVKNANRNLVPTKVPVLITLYSRTDPKKVAYEYKSIESWDGVARLSKDQRFNLAGYRAGSEGKYGEIKNGVLITLESGSGYISNDGMIRALRECKFLDPNEKRASK